LVAECFTVCRRGYPFGESFLQREDRMPLLWIVVLILLILAVGGGVAVNSLLWLVLVVALIVAIFAMMSGRRV
jgi:uncharacterized membrane protein